MRQAGVLAAAGLYASGASCAAAGAGSRECRIPCAGVARFGLARRAAANQYFVRRHPGSQGGRFEEPSAAARHPRNHHAAHASGDASGCAARQNTTPPYERFATIRTGSSRRGRAAAVYTAFTPAAVNSSLFFDLTPNFPPVDILYLGNDRRVLAADAGPGRRLRGAGAAQMTWAYLLSGDHCRRAARLSGGCACSEPRICDDCPSLVDAGIVFGGAGCSGVSPCDLHGAHRRCQADRRSLRADRSASSIEHPESMPRRTCPGRATPSHCCCSTPWARWSSICVQRLQVWLPLNPQSLANVTPDSAFDTAVSFVTNTNWQGYAGESTMSYFTQMVALAVQNFFSAATGLAVAFALMRGFARRSAQGIGNFWVDLTRGTLYVLLPLSAAPGGGLHGAGRHPEFRRLQGREPAGKPDLHPTQARCGRDNRSRTPPAMRSPRP